MHFKIAIHIPEGQIAGVSVGTEASISLPAYPDKKDCRQSNTVLRLCG